jgi:hypothetical protein
MGTEHIGHSFLLTYLIINFQLIVSVEFVLLEQFTTVSVMQMVC